MSLSLFIWKVGFIDVLGRVSVRMTKVMHMPTISFPLVSVTSARSEGRGLCDPSWHSEVVECLGL